LTPVPVTFSPQQYKFCLSTIRQLKKSKDAGPFLNPVDPIALGIPHYFTIIKHPMDLGTVERKVQSSNPNKPDPNLVNARYRNSAEFIHDVKLIFSNTVTFNGPDHAISLMGKRLEVLFDKSVKQMPPPAEVRVAKKILYFSDIFVGSQAYCQEGTATAAASCCPSVSASYKKATNAPTVNISSHDPSLRE
jgi:hypothetical protein